MILSGDFNETPESQTIKLMEETFTDLYTLANTGQKYPNFTTFKQDKGEQTKKTVDYMFLQNNEWLKGGKVKIYEYLDPQDVEDDG